MSIGMITVKMRDGEQQFFEDYKDIKYEIGFVVITTATSKRISIPSSNVVEIEEVPYRGVGW